MHRLLLVIISLTQFGADSVSLITALQSTLCASEHKRSQDVGEEVMDAVIPCSCEAVEKLLDLGKEYFPRYLPSVGCNSRTCWRGPYRCKQRKYGVKVLKKQDQADKINETRDLSLPESLRPIWKFVLMPVTVACVCSL